MVRTGRSSSVILTMLDWSDPFEVDEVNRPHLMARPGLNLGDAYDVLMGDPEVYEDLSDGSGDWVIVGVVPGDEILAVPVCQSRHSGYEKVRPITVIVAPLDLQQRYLEDKWGEEGRADE